MVRAVQVTCYYKLANSEARRSDCDQDVPPQTICVWSSENDRAPSSAATSPGFFLQAGPGAFTRAHLPSSAGAGQGPDDLPAGGSPQASQQSLPGSGLRA